MLPIVGPTGPLVTSLGSLTIVPSSEQPEPPKLTSILDDPSFQEMLKVAEQRAALQLGFLYLQDTKPTISEISRTLSDNFFILSEAENPIRMLFTFNLLNFRLLDRHQLGEITLDPSNVVVIAEALQLEQPLIQKLQNFVFSGGKIVSFNTAAVVIEQIFPNYIKSKSGTTTVHKSIEISILDEDNELFKTYYALNGRATRMEGIRRFSVLDQSKANTLIKETKPTEMPLAVTWNHGSGFVFHSVLSHVVDVSFFTTMPTRDNVQKILKNQIENKQELQEATRAAFKTAVNCAFHNSVILALAYQPFLEFFFVLLNRLCFRNTVKVEEEE